jgi:small-conductance mechanosensitive channel
MEWIEGRISKRSVDAARATPAMQHTVELTYISDKLDLESAREKILELMHEIEALRREQSGSHVERLKAQLSTSYATSRGFKQQWEDEREENEKLSAALKREREEVEKLNAALQLARLEKDNLTQLTCSLRGQVDGLRAIIEIIANRLERRPCPLRLAEIVDGDHGERVPGDLAA